jgi:hypothetical protein
MEEVTIIAGIPIPSTSPWFLGVVAIHVAMGMVCVVAGIGAMLSRKGRGRHSTFGTVYFWFLLGVFVTATALSVVRWAENYHLFVLGVVRRRAGRPADARRGPMTPTRLQVHFVGMAASYVLLLTAFYVDNGKNLPVWRHLPTIVYWLGPAAVALPVVVYALLRHRLLG